MTKFLFNLFKKQSEARPLTLAQLEYAFTDSKKRKYYKFPEQMALPIERFGKLNEFMMWMSAGITGDEMDKLVNEADKYLTDGLVNKKNAAKIGFILTMLKERKAMVLHTELLYNFICVQLVREDELPEYFNNEIQMQKVSQFKDETREGKTYDFFLRIGLKKLNALYNMSEDEWNKFWEQSIKEQVLLREAIKMLEQESLSTEKA